MSGSNIGDGLITTLQAASSFSAGNLSKNDYGILETTTACALIVMPGGVAAAEHAFGGAWHLVWDIGLEIYVKDLSDPIQSLNNVWLVEDAVVAAIRADTTLDSSACRAIVTSMDRPRGTMVEMHGNEWFPIYATVQAEEYQGVSGDLAPGLDVYVSLEVSGSERNIRPDITGAVLVRDVNTPETTRLSTEQLRVSRGPEDWRLECTAYYNSASGGSEGVLRSLVGVQTLMVYGPSGSTSGGIKYSGSGIVGECRINSPLGEPATLAFSVVASAGSLTRGQF
jgi:hypothetical protein